MHALAPLRARRLRLGIVANEFFDRRLGRMGGFGWAAAQVARRFSQDATLGVDVTLISPDPNVSPAQVAGRAHGAPLLRFAPHNLLDLQYLARLGIDLLLTIDYRPNYTALCDALPRTPIIVWARDPHAPDDTATIQTLRAPDDAQGLPCGASAIDCQSLGALARASQRTGRPLAIASPAPSLLSKANRAYGLELDELPLLPNIIDLEPGTVKKCERPRVLFLGRLEPIKRPWLFLELARRFPEVEFVLAGGAYLPPGVGWHPDHLPENVCPTGHLGGHEKLDALRSAWALVNTSIHEGLPVSFLEALRCETPLLSCQNPEGVVARYGIYVGPHSGDGQSALPAFEEALARLLHSHALREQLGRAGRQWVEATHSFAQFLAAFDALAATLGVHR